MLIYLSVTLPRNMVNAGLDPTTDPVMAFGLSRYGQRGVEWSGARGSGVDIDVRSGDVRFGSLADIASRQLHVRFAPLGKYCRSKPLVFSLLPRYQGLRGSQK
jgi:hypothetical protein